MDTSEPPVAATLAPAVPSIWREQLTERERMQIAWAETYAASFRHGATGHNDMLLIARLAELLDVAAGIRDQPPPAEASDLVLSFGKYHGLTLSQVLRADRGYLEWLAREGRDAEVRQAAAAVLRGPMLPLPLDDAPPAAPAEDGELPF